MRLFNHTQGALGLSAALIIASVASVAALPQGSTDTYDYIVVGSGPGGGPLAVNLAKAGFRTLLLEAGDDESADRRTQALALSEVPIPANLGWSFWVRHYDDDEQTRRYQRLTWRLPNGDLWVGPGTSAPPGAEMLGVQYPRGATLGGSTLVNAGFNILPSERDWSQIEALTGDSSWNPERMREIFVKTEKNLYLPRGTPGHGFDGYLQLNEGNGTVFTTSPQSSEIYRSLVSEIGQDPDELEQLFDTDPNQLRSDRDQTVGLFGGVFHANGTWGRYSVRDRVLDTLRAVDSSGRKKYPLEVRLNSFASKVLFEESINGSAPRAIGIEYLEGKSIYQGDLRYNASNTATTKQVYANKEVIVSGGTFNTPQLLLLSGIGPAADLEALNITVVADLPGVGRNMQDHNEIATIGLAAQNISVDGASGFPRSQCTPHAPNDPCYSLWQQGQGPYAEGSIMGSMFFLKTNHSSTDERDIGMWSGPVGVRGFWPGTPNQSFVDPPNTFGFHTVHMHGSNRAGYVKLRSADPTAQPEINFRHFADEGADQDIAAIKEAVAFFRRVHAGVAAPVGPNEVIWPTCSGSVNAEGGCSDEGNDEQFIRDNNYGHHATSTSSIGSDDDPNAVLDSKFRVRGVEGLRVVDASAFPRAPGAFPVLAVFMLSEKAALDILSTQ
ncbi:uncharacterized protein ALTATR162_LOCUS11690 [Alternaria atra]|uniref:Glucose-methanol-choline oxidoreductase N-terminal domain-containing protein n=1 Tax=Alternaria atra TaxID=119953 RepID=A0A8J2IHQ8_9PLEO|nr:uncharacterized protein ALTATR162_LOCUS11690 [Alternaria atra]CAG5186742.1 unnamed protein product [Alternaria atra]